MKELTPPSSTSTPFPLRDYLSSLRPKLRNGTCLLPVKGGIYLRNDTQEAFVYAESAYELMRTLSPHLTGNRTVSEIRGVFQDQAVEGVTELINFLFQNGFVTHLLDDTRDELLKTVGAQFETQIQFLSHCSTKPWAAFRDFRNTRLLLVGSGISFQTCAAALLRSGLEQLSVWPITANQAEVDLKKINDAASAVQAQGANAVVSIVAPGRQKSLAAYDLIAWCTDLPYLREFLALERRSTLFGRPLYPGIIIGNHGFMGPMRKSGSDSCWACSMMRLATDFIEESLRRSFRQRYVRSNLPFGPEFTPSDRIARMIGAEVAFELFKARAGNIRPEMRSCLQVYTANQQEPIQVDLVPSPPDSCVGMCQSLKKRQVEYRISSNGGGAYVHPIYNS